MKILFLILMCFLHNATYTMFAQALKTTRDTPAASTTLPENNFSKGCSFLKQANNHEMPLSFRYRGYLAARKHLQASLHTDGLTETQQTLVRSFLEKLNDHILDAEAQLILHACGVHN